MLNNLTILAEATAATKSKGGLPIELMVGVIIFMFAMMFLSFRSQKKQAKKRAEMITAVKVGDKVLSSGGIYGTITAVKETTFTLEIADKVKVELDHNGIATVIQEEISK